MDNWSKFWEILKPVAKWVGFEFLKNRRVAVDLSYWVVLHLETSISSRSKIPNPHIRLTFFRTINLFTKLGAYPVFVVDGTLSPLKAKAKMARFFRSSSGIIDNNILTDDGERCQVYEKCIEECVQLLQLLGMPVLRAKGDAMELCAKLNYEHKVAACITDDMDAFLYGAEFVIKRIHRKAKMPFECYELDDIRVGLSLDKKRLIATAFLVGIGCDVRDAIRFVRIFRTDELFKRLREIARGEPLVIQPHFEFSCQNASSTAGEITCPEKPGNETWQVAVCQKIAQGKSFPSDDVIQMYLEYHHEKIGDLGCGSPKTELLVDYVASRHKLKPSYIWQRLFPMLTTIYLRSMDSSLTKKNLLLLNDEPYEFHNIESVKTRVGGYVFCVVNWRKAGSELDINCEDGVHLLSKELGEKLDLLEEPRGVLRKCCNLLQTNEDMNLVRNAFPEEVDRFWKAESQVLKEEREPQKKKSKLGCEEGLTNVQVVGKKKFYSTAIGFRPKKLDDGNGSSGQIS